MRKVSKKRAAELRKYKKERDKFLQENDECQAKLSCCTGVATEIHHKSGRQNKRLLDQSLWMAICRPCHTWATEHSKEAIELGISKSRLKV